MRTFVKSAYEEHFKKFDWSDRMAEGDSVAASTWLVGAGLTGANATYDTHSSSIELTGGTETTQYLVTNQIETLDGEKLQRSFHMLVKPR